MAHGDEHGHGGHDNETRLLWTAVITGGFMLVEVVGGIFAGSLALLADAGHMVMDVAGLALAWFAFRVSRWPADRQRTYGFERMQVLVAFANGLALFVVAGAIVIEAVRRFADPAPVLAGPMLAIAVAGMAVNLVMFFVLHGADRRNLNIRGAMVHVLGDLLGSAGVIVAALVILATGWVQADPLISVLVAVIILRSAWFVVRDSASILLEAAPRDFSVPALAADLEEHVAGVADVHHVHAWSITEERPMVTLHARIDDKTNADDAVVAIKERLRSRFGVTHATVEVERAGCADADMEPGMRRHHQPGHSH